ncbi:hypothetical protein F7P69_04955 [Cellulosimicrobium funkei]|nr:hypothetical protein [Cellulosimicrobium funkei]
MAFLIVLPVLGWLLSAAGLFFVIARALGSKTLVRDALIALTFAATAQIAFSVGLGLNLPNGVIGVLASWIS